MKLHDMIGRLSAKILKKAILKKAIRVGCDIDGDIIYIRKGKKKVRIYTYYIHIFSGIVNYCPPNASVVKGKKFTTIFPRSNKNA